MRRRYCNPRNSPPEPPKKTRSTSITPQQLPAYPYPATPTPSTSLTHPAPSNAPPRSVAPPCASPGALTASTWNTTPGSPSLGRPPTANYAPWQTPSRCHAVTPSPSATIQPRNIWVVVDATVDIHLTRRLVDLHLQRALESGLTTQAFRLWMAFRGMHPQAALHIVKQKSHRYTYGNGRADTHAKYQSTSHTPGFEHVPLDSPHHSHLQHLPPIPSATGPPKWMPEDTPYTDRD